jgi:tetratricopeptide (TPR) repeat protein
LSPRPNDASFWRASFLAATGKPDAAIAEAERAQSLDPLSAIVGAGVSWMYHLARRYDDERAQALKALDLNPQLAMAHMRLGWALTGLGRHDEAIQAHQAAVKYSGESPDMTAALACALAAAGRRQPAREILDRLTTLSSQRYVSSLSIAQVHAALGDRSSALAALETAYEERAWGLALIGTEVALDPVRSEQRFTELLRRMRVPVRSR